MEFEYLVTVRGYELDSFNHVNNAVYVNYLEQSRWQMLKDSDTLPFFKENKIIPAVIETTIRYIREAKLFDDLLITTEVVLEEPYVVFNHKIYNKTTQKKCCTAKVKHLFLDENKFACKLPDHILKKWGC